MNKMIFISLPVADLGHSSRFYEAIGCRRNARLSDGKVSSMTWSDTITFQLMTRDCFAGLTEKPVGDGRQVAAMLIALPLESREAVDTMVEAAWSYGGYVDAREPRDLGFLYLRTFEDPDGHLFEAACLVAEDDRRPGEADAGIEAGRPGLTDDRVPT